MEGKRTLILFKIFSFTYLLYILSFIFYYVSYIYKTFVSGIYYQHSFMADNFILYSFSITYFLILILLAVGLTNLNELARKLIIFRYSMYLIITIIADLISFKLYADVIKHNLLYFTISSFIALESIIMIYILSNNRIKSLFPRIRLSIARIVILCFMASILCISQFFDIKKRIPQMAYDLAKQYYKVNDFDVALGYFKSVLEHNNKDIYANHSIGLCYLNLGNNEEAIKYFNKTITLKKDYAEAYSALGSAYMNMKDYKQAVTPLKKAIKLKSKEVAKNYGNLGYAYRELGQLDKTLETYKECIAKYPQHPEMYTLLHSECYINDLKEEGLKVLINGLKANPNSDEICFALAVHYLFENDTEKALYYLEKTITLDNAYLKKIRSDNIFDDIRNTEEFNRILRKLSRAPK